MKGHWDKYCLSKPKINEVYVDSNIEDDLGFLGSVEENESDDSIDSVESKPWIMDVPVNGIKRTFKLDRGA